jgi:disulfide oxidoreductase YuzD
MNNSFLKEPFQEFKTGLLPGMTTEEKEFAWLKAGFARNYTERFSFSMRLISIHRAVINGKYCLQYF